MQKVLIAVVTCHKYRDRADAQRATWVNDAKCDVRFFLGGGEKQRDDEVILDVDDGYEGLPEKVKAMFRWALEQEYQMALRMDDDVYLRPERALECAPFGLDYSGRVRGASDMMHPWPYCSGFCYWLSDVAMRLVVNSSVTDQAEDRMVGRIMFEAQIDPVHDGRYVIVHAARSAADSQEGPRKDNDIIASCEWDANSIAVAHQEFLSSPAKEKYQPPFDKDFSRIDILIKTIHRDGYLRRTIAAIRENMPAARMVIMDDGMNAHFKPFLYAELRSQGHAIHQMKYDSGFGAKSNAAIRFYQREFVLIASDDFDFSKKETCEQIRRMVRVLDHDNDISIASGRWRGNPYEFLLDIQGDTCRELPIEKPEWRRVDDVRYHRCDLTVNYSLIRREVLGPEKLHWWNDVKIGGGEHGAFFIKAKKLGVGVAYVEGVNIDEQRYFVGALNDAYHGLRARARQEGRPALRREGIRLYYCCGSDTPEVC